MFAAVDRLVPRVNALTAVLAARHRRRAQQHRQAVRNLLTTPFVYSLGVPLVLLDVWVSLYQWICFPVYGIDCVRRSRYFALDRHRLGYLTAIEKANCLYCSYATGLFAYVREVAARTEQYWCPIKHAQRVVAPHSRYADFAEYGDAPGYRHNLPRLRQALRPIRAHPRRYRR
jgi:hypothetical protein